MESQDTQATAAITAVKQSLSQPEPIERSKLISPAPIDEPSLTPPPSSQVPALMKNGSSTPAAAVTSFLASPPATTQAADAHVTTSVPIDPLSAAQINTASIEELRRMVSDLNIALVEARTTAASQTLQLNMLTASHRESENRMSVELNMAHRESEVLAAAEQRRKQELMSPAQTAADVNNAHALLNDMTAHSARLQNENNQLREHIAQLQRELGYKIEELRDKTAEVKRLQDRIRQNREHMTGFLDNLSENNASPSIFGTPRRTPHSHSTPRHGPSSAPRKDYGLDNPGLEAILLADKVLREETASQPYTPSRNPVKPRGHTRGTQSLSSLPSTPTRPTVRASAPNTLRTPPQSLAAILEPPMSVQQPIQARPPPPFSLATGPGAQQFADAQRRRRRASSDSTITASSVEGEDERGASGGDDIPESQASQAATSMLRATPVDKGGSARSSFNSINSSVGGGGGGASSIIQGKLSAMKVMKSGGSSGKAADAMSPEKRRLTSYGSDPAMMGSPKKKTRMTSEGVGLGIGIGNAATQ